MSISRSLLLTIGIILILLPTHTEAQNAGIVRGLWFNTEQFFVGDTVRVYVAVRNNTGADLSGTVEFYVNSERIERNSINALDGRIVESWADLKPAYGTSTVLATLSRTELSSTASGTQAITVTSSLAEEVIFVDRDTDGDDIGNREDTGDDGDGIPDTDDVEPQIFNRSVTATEESPEAKDTPPPVETVEQVSSSEPVGLEQFLTPSRADSTLERVTETITNTKRRLDDYRSTRTQSSTNPTSSNTDSPTSTATSTNSTTSSETAHDGGFGAIERRNTEVTKTNWMATTIRLITTLADYLYTTVLAVVSFVLGYPILIQLTLLLLIIFGIIKMAKRLAGRPIKS